MTDMDRWAIRNEEMQHAVNEACKSDGHDEVPVYYSAYKMDDEDLPVNNLNEVAAKGTFRIMRDEPYFGNGNIYDGGVMTNPTWLQLAVHNNASIIEIEDRHHVFFEGIHVKGDEIWMYNGS